MPEIFFVDFFVRFSSLSGLRYGLGLRAFFRFGGAHAGEIYAVPVHVGTELLKQFLPVVRAVGIGLVLPVLNGKPPTGGLSPVEGLFRQSQGLLGKADLISTISFGVSGCTTPCGARGFVKRPVDSALEMLMDTAASTRHRRHCVMTGNFCR